jgi:hypothetical protein
MRPSDYGSTKDGREKYEEPSEKNFIKKQKKKKCTLQVPENMVSSQIVIYFHILAL